MSTESWLTKYRPFELDEMLGQDSLVRAFGQALDREAGRAFLFTGPPGTGKTTLARIGARKLGCSDLIECDAATYTGIDSMREITDRILYRPLGGGNTGVLIDEAHALSSAAWKALLKSVEEPPPWVYWFFATTEPTKVPEAVRTRCLRFDLKPVSSSDLEALVTMVAAAEGLDIGPEAPAILALAAQEADGSPRQALANLGVVAAARSPAEAADLLRSAVMVPEAVEVARALVAGTSWEALQPLLAEIQSKSPNPSSVAYTVRAYVKKVIMGASSPRTAVQGLAILEAFSAPCHPDDLLLLACGRLTLGGNNGPPF